MLKAIDVAHEEVVGKTSNGDDVIHYVSKGGRHYMAKKNQYGVVHPDPIGVGPHRAIAKHMADMKTNNGITWNEKLYKSNDLEKASVYEGIHDFDGQKHHIKINKLKSGRYLSHVSPGEKQITAPGSIHTINHTANKNGGFKISHEVPYAHQGGTNSPTSKEVRAFVSNKINEHFNKSEEIYNDLEKAELESTPEKHIAMGDFHSLLANKYAHIKANPEVHAKEVNDYYRSFTPKHKDMTPFQLSHDVSMHHLIHKDTALKHYKMGGLSQEEALTRLANKIDPRMSLQAKEPHSESELSMAWSRKNPYLSTPTGKTDWAK